MREPPVDENELQSRRAQTYVVLSERQPIKGPYRNDQASPLSYASKTLPVLMDVHAVDGPLSLGLFVVSNRSIIVKLLCVSLYRFPARLFERDTQQNRHRQP